MDARLDVYRMLGLDLGQAHVIRNAGGVIDDDAIRSLLISQRLLGTTEIVLIHHRDCGMLTFDGEELKDQIRQSMARIQDSPFLPTERPGLRLRRRHRQARRGDVIPRLFLVLALATVTAGCGGEGGPEQPGAARVVRVVDGDTIVVRIGGLEESVRLLGVDTPESVDPRSPVECFGEEASHHTRALLPPGTDVQLVRDVEARDQYSRLLAYVYRRDNGAFVNLQLVRDGFADVLTFPPNVAHADDFTAAATQARADELGLWSAC